MLHSLHNQDFLQYIFSFLHARVHDDVHGAHDRGRGRSYMCHARDGRDRSCMFHVRDGHGVRGRGRDRSCMLHACDGRGVHDRGRDRSRMLHARDGRGVRGSGRDRSCMFHVRDDGVLRCGVHNNILHGVRVYDDVP